MWSKNNNLESLKFVFVLLFYYVHTLLSRTMVNLKNVASVFTFQIFQRFTSYANISHLWYSFPFWNYVCYNFSLEDGFE